MFGSMRLRNVLGRARTWLTSRTRDVPHPVRAAQAWWTDRKHARMRKDIGDRLEQLYGADDFQRCERAYNAALTWYDRLGYRLVVLGDVEELWENSFKEVSEQYAATLCLE